MRKFIIPVLSLFLIFSCDLTPPEDKEEDKPTAMENILDDYSRSLESVLTSSQAELLVTEAKNLVGDEQSEDPTVIIPLAVETLISSLSAVSTLTAESRIEVIDTITEASVTIANQELSVTSRNSRAVDLTKLKTILNKVAKSLVKSVPKSGLDKADFSTANESCLETFVSTLDDADVSETNILELTESVTEGAVSQIKDSQSDYTNFGEIVKSISQGAVKGIVNIQAATIGKQDLVQSITKAALNGVAQLDTNPEAVTILIVVVTDGATAGINDIKSQLQVTDITNAIKGISKETIESVKNLNITDDEKKLAVTNLSTKINEKVKANLADVDTTEAIKAVVAGIAAGAQNVSEEYNDLNTVLSAIDIKDDSGNSIDLEEYAEDIQGGIDEGLQEIKEEADETEKIFIGLRTLVRDLDRDDTTQIDDAISQIETAITSYPNYEKIAEMKHYLANLYGRKFELKGIDDPQDSDILKAIQYAKESIGDYSDTSWYVFYSIIGLADYYRFVLKDYDTANEYLENINTYFEDQPVKVLRAKWEIIRTYQQIWHDTNDEMKKDGTHLQFINVTLMPLVDELLTEANTLIDYTHPEDWILKEAIQSKADALIWAGDLEGALNYLEEQVAILEESTLDPDLESIAKANLYYIAGKIFYNKAQEWGDDKPEFDDMAIEALTEAEMLAWNDGIILDEWLYVDISTELLSAISQKSGSLYFYSKEDIPKEFFHLIDKTEELIPRMRALGNDHSGQYARIISYIRVGTLFKNIGREIKGFDDELAERYLKHSKEILSEVFTAYKANEYPQMEEWAATDILGNLFEAIYALDGFEEALIFLEENIGLYDYKQWALGPIFMQVYQELNQMIMFTYYNSNGLSENEVIENFNALKAVADTYYEAMFKLVTDYNYEWYAGETVAYASKFYYMYFYYIKQTTESTTDEAIIDARMKAAELGPGSSWAGETVNNEDMAWYYDLFTEDSNQYGGIILEGGINVTIK